MIELKNNFPLLCYGYIFTYQIFLALKEVIPLSYIWLIMFI